MVFIIVSATCFLVRAQTRPRPPARRTMLASLVWRVLSMARIRSEQHRFSFLFEQIVRTPAQGSGCHSRRTWKALSAMCVCVYMRHVIATLICHGHRMWRKNDNAETCVVCLCQRGAGIAECIENSSVERFKATVVINHDRVCRHLLCDFKSSKNIFGNAN